MATRDHIEMNFRQTLAQADKLDELAERLSNVSDKQFGGSLQNLAAGWKGENASLYMQKGSKLQDKMNTSVKDLHNTAASIRKAAQRLYAAEMAALAIAQTRVH